MKLWMIRHNPTGKYMPLNPHNRGYTALGLDEFVAFGQAGTVPRLLTSLSGARMAIAAWNKGAWVTHESYGDDGDDYDRWSVPPKEKPADRIAADLQAVQCELVPKAD